LFRRPATLLVAVLLLLACAPAGPRPLTESELAQLEVAGGVSKWLPIRFTAEVTNGLEDLTVTEVSFEVHGKRVSRETRIRPGEMKRLRMQYLFPEDPDFGSVDKETFDTEKIVWRLAGAVAEP
jgi:hypothetical protein